MEERTPNPFRPGFNQAPAVLAGRDEVMDAIREAMDVARLDARTPRPLLLTGSRGVGKTVILGGARDLAASEHSWLTAAVEAHPTRPFPPRLVDELRHARDLYRQSPEKGAARWTLAATKVKASVAGLGAEAEFQRRTPTSPEHVADDLRSSLKEAMEAAMARDAGLLLTLDEAHLASIGDLATLAAELQHAVEEAWPLVAILAGLPSMQDPRRTPTYLERGEWHPLSLLSEADTRHALTVTAEEAGRPMAADAVDVLAGASGGYPYAIQVFGHHAWRAAHGQGSITLEAARTGIAAAERDLAAGLYTSRWEDATPRERDYLIAVATLQIVGEDPTGGAVARELDQPATAVSYLRSRLLKKGTIYTSGQSLRFAVPGMAEWITERQQD